MSKLKSDLSIILVSFKSKEKVTKILTKLKKQCKIIVVENSNDKSLEKKFYKSKNISFYYPQLNKGFASGLNYGVNKAKTKFILYLDIDTKINSFQIKKLYSKVKNIINFGVVTAKIKDQNYNDLILGRDKITKMNYVKFNTGCVMFFNRKTFLNLGGFDENFFLYFEESDFYERCMYKNKKIFLFEGILVEHEGRGSIDSAYKKKYEVYGLYEIREINKRPESIFLVEGYMDVIGLYQHGVKNAVASSGTAFTQEQLRKILSYTNNIFIVFDGDEAGYKASWRAVENALSIIREDTRISFIFLNPGEDPDSFIGTHGKDAFLNLTKNAKTLSDFFIETIKEQDDLSSVEGRSMVAKFALPLINKISNDTLKQVYINEMSKICDLDFSKLIEGESKIQKFSAPQKEEAQETSNSVIKKSVLGIFMGLIQHPKLTTLQEFNSIKKNSKFIFLKEIRDLYIENPDSSPSIIFEKIKIEKIKNIFGEALVSEIKLSQEDAEAMIRDCLQIILKSDSEREQFLIEKFNMQELSPAEKRELQQIILKKAKMSQDDEALIKNLSSN